MDKGNIAVIDLGTNTFHLLIVSATDPDLTPIYRERRFIKLAEDGIETIGEAPFRRGMEAMTAFAQQLKNHKVEEVKAFGTAALRTASNGPAFIEQVKDKTGINIQLIDGNREAALIHKGVQLAVPPSKDFRLIMDIGGGSVEFIIANDHEVAWAQSFPIGVAVLYKTFHTEEPISAANKLRLEQFLKDTLPALAAALKEYPCKELVGASGTFDVLDNMLASEHPNPNCAVIDTAIMGQIFTTIVNSSLEARRKIDKMPLDRADMIVVALLLIGYIVNLARIERILVSRYAMKEGMLSEMR